MSESKSETRPNPRATAFGTLSPTRILAKLSKITSTLPGLVATLMLVQYSSPLVITLLLKLAALKARYPSLRTRARIGARAGGGKVVGGPGFGLRELALGWGKMGGSIGEARVVMRAFGLLPIIQWLLALHPSPLASLKSLLSLSPKTLQTEKTLPTLQVLSLLLYYPLEHIAWLAKKGVLPLSERKVGKAELWSVRFWALYVLLEVFKLRETYVSLLRRTKLLRSTKPVISEKEAGAYELEPANATAIEAASSIAERTSETGSKDGDKLVVMQALQKDWEDWKIAVAVNSGYAPLTIHWSTPGGLWSSPLITGTLGSVAAVGRLTKAWRTE